MLFIEHLLGEHLILGTDLVLIPKGYEAFYAKKAVPRRLDRIPDKLQSKVRLHFSDERGTIRTTLCSLLSAVLTMTMLLSSIMRNVKQCEMRNEMKNNKCLY